jgi:hypothetical protein
MQQAMPETADFVSRLGQQCIAYEADDRPTFREVGRTLGAIKARLKGTSEDDNASVKFSQRAFSFPR